VQSGWAVGWGLAVLSQAILYSWLPPETAWRWMFAIGALPALLVFFLRRYVEEPAIAAATLAKQNASGERPGIAEIFARPMLKTTVLASLAVTGCQGGYYAITFWVPRFLTNERKLSIVGSTGYLAALIIGSFIGYLVGAWLADKIGRRNLFLYFSLGAIGVILLYTQLPLTNEVLWLLGFPLGFFASAHFSGIGAFLTELYPTRLADRARAFAIISAAASARYFRFWSAHSQSRHRSATPSPSLRCWPMDCSLSRPSRYRKHAARFCTRTVEPGPSCMMAVF
jgi:MFS family permease